jgi:hypothetical protein
MWSKAEHILTSEHVERSLILLNTWVRKNGWAGYDPYDIKGVPTLTWLQKYGLLRKGFNIVAETCPKAIRRFFRVEPAVNAKAMALFARAYLNLYRHKADEQFLKATNECLTWLLENSRRDYSGPCWGYPFDWQTQIFIPRETPSGVVTSMAALAFLQAYDFFGEESYLEVAKGCCDFFNNDLHWDQITPEAGCFSYTPLDFFHVHNANLWVAATLYRVSTYISDMPHLDRAKQALKYTLEAQSSDGSWTYRGRPDLIPGAIDNYHTGFVLRALLDIYNIDPNQELLSALRKGAYFYRRELFNNSRIPRRTVKRTYPIDIHSCSEAILCFSALSALFPELLGAACEVIDWTLANMQSPQGFFYYRNYKIYTSKTEFIRWGQAWMLFALSEYLLRVSGGVQNSGPGCSHG